MRFVPFIIFLTGFRFGTTLDCTQIQDSQIFDGSKVYLPGGDGSLQEIPANFNCIYTIKAPANSTRGFSGNVVISNGIRGVNDFIVVTEQNGTQTTMNNRTGLGGVPYQYTIIPGAQMTIEVITKSVFMGSMFSITVEYVAANIGPTLQMKTNGEMNYFDLSSLNNGRNSFKTVTFVGNESIYLTRANTEDYLMKFDDYYVIDGTLENVTGIYRRVSWELDSLLTKSNAVTILSNVDNFLGVVPNTKSESEKYNVGYSIATDKDFKGGYGLSHSGDQNLKTVTEIVNFPSTGIILQILSTEPVNDCDAYVLSGPPNDLSTVLVNITSADVHYLDVKYLSLVTGNCTLDFRVNSYQN